MFAELGIGEIHIIDTFKHFDLPKQGHLRPPVLNGARLSEAAS